MVERAAGTRGLWLAMAAFAVAATAFAGGAEAEAKGSPKLRTASAVATASGGGTLASATAKCPAKTQAVAGGYTTSVPALPPAANPHWLNIHESQRVGNKAWRVSGVQAQPSGSDTLTAFVYCEALKAKVRTASKSVALPAIVNLGVTAFATCPKGTKPLSGGFSLPPASVGGSSLVSRSITGNGIGWVVDATRVSGADLRNLIAYAYCAKTGAIKTKSASASVLAPPNTTATATSGRCPKKTSARGGGFATSTPVGGLAGAALVYESRGLGTSWTSSASASGASTSSTLVTNAYCR